MERQEKIRVLASQLTQVAPYVFQVYDGSKFDEVRSAIDSLAGSGSRVVALDGFRLRISDPVCRELEIAGCEDFTESGESLKVFSKLEKSSPKFTKSGSFYR